MPPGDLRIFLFAWVAIWFNADDADLASKRPLVTVPKARQSSTLDLLYTKSIPGASAFAVRITVTPSFGVS
jgi:hypothetical protein